jgi:hypothetical protein
MKFLLILFLAPLSLLAQNVMLEHDVNKDTIPEEKGANMKKYSHMYMGQGLILGGSEGDGAEIRYGNSTEFTIGFRHKRKISNFYSIGYDLSYSVLSYNLKQDSGKVLPNPVLHDNEKINFNNINLGVYQRFNFGKRGNVIGKFLDMGAFGNVPFIIRHVHKNKHDVANMDNASYTKVSNRGLVYTNPYNYGVMARLGFNRYVFYGTYRLSNQFKDGFIYPELPRFTAGLQISFHS